MHLPAIILACVTLQRLAELVLARRNTQILLARGAHEIGARHYPLIVLLHTSWLVTLWLSVGDRPANWWALGPFIALQPLRLWVLLSLKERWTTRIIVLENAPLVAAGPYRFLSHPNYLIVALEIPLLPLSFGLIWQAVAFSVANLILLALRIRVETSALRAAGQSGKMKPGGPF